MILKELIYELIFSPASPILRTQALPASSQKCCRHYNGQQTPESNEVCLPLILRMTLNPSRQLTHPFQLPDSTQSVLPHRSISRRNPASRAPLPEPPPPTLHARRDPARQTRP